jgi:hypothetical protein
MQSLGLTGLYEFLKNAQFFKEPSDQKFRVSPNLKPHPRPLTDDQRHYLRPGTSKRRAKLRAALNPEAKP